MHFYVYMLISKGSKPVSYVGYTNNLKNRIKLHNSGKGAKFTRGRKWKLIYKKSFKNKIDAMKYEYILKNDYSLRKRLKKKFKDEQN